MLSANLRIERRAIKQKITFFNDHLLFEGRPLEIRLGLTAKLVTNERLVISLDGHLGRRVKTFLEKIFLRHGRWACCQLEQVQSNECCLQGDRYRAGKHFTFTVPMVRPKALLGDFEATLQYTRDGWLVIRTKGGEIDALIDCLARSLDLQGWILPNHWYQKLYNYLNVRRL